MMELKVKLYRHLHKGTWRGLTQTECTQLRDTTSLWPTRSKAWRLYRDDDGAYSLWFKDRSGEGATWAITGEN